MIAVLEKAEHTLELLVKNVGLAMYVDKTHLIPQPFKGTGVIKLIILGQDPTVKDASNREKIKTVLNLDTNGSARAYLSGICQQIGIDLLRNGYATNLFKNFFTSPPTEIKDINIFKEFLGAWLPLLKEELAPFENVPMITLGEPVLKHLLAKETPHPLREHWGYMPEWKYGNLGLFKFVRPDENILGRQLFPFPHQPSLRREFYKKRLNDYISFMKKNAFPG